MEKRQIKKRIGVVHVLAECEDCGATFGNHKNGQALAAKHAKHHKHFVRCEVGIVCWYDGREGQQEVEKARAE